MSFEKCFLTGLLVLVIFSTSGEGYTRINAFGTFGQGMLVNWKYPLPATGSGSVALDFYDESDVPLHIRPYYGSNTLVLDTLTNGVWTGQERPRDFPFLRGAINDVTVHANATGFDIYANSGAFHYVYNYRHDVTQIKELAYGYSGVHNISVGKVLPNFTYGKAVYIHGTAPNTCTNFTIDLVQTSACNYSNSNIHLRLKVQLEQPQVVIRNSRSGNSWGVEERNGDMPFSPGQPFTVMIVAQLFGFEVAVNGNHFTYYQYRQPLNSQMVVVLTGVRYIQKIEYF